MGVIKHFSSSSYDDDKRIGPMSSWGSLSDDDIVYRDGSAAIYLPNPNPENFTIERSAYFNGLTILIVKYHDCTNYEGRKIMVYEGIPEDIINQGHLDPHFTNNTKFHSPIARFEPTDRGWEMALKFAYAWTHE